MKQNNNAILGKYQDFKDLRGLCRLIDYSIEFCKTPEVLVNTH
jgi:hypothetical protein